MIPRVSDRICLAAREHGVLTRVLVGGGLQISPPLIITAADLEELRIGLGAALGAVTVTV